VTADPTLLLAWLVLAHLVADFMLQTDSIVADKAAPGRRAIRGLGLHGLGVAACLVPVGIAFGAAGWWLLVVVTASHILVDRMKAVATARIRASMSAGDGHVGAGWSPLPGAFFALDQVVHLTILLVAFAVLLAGAPVDPGFAAWVDGASRGADPALVHRVALTVVVAIALVLVNVRAGSLFVGTLVGAPPPRPADRPAPAPAAAGQRAWTLRVGPLEGRVEAEDDPPPPAAPAPVPPERVGEVIGILERLLVATLVLAQAEVAIGLVIAAKTIARFRQLDDRDFAEYYLLGTLASVAVAVLSALVAGAALGTAP
jgi:hypothetical protein